MKIVIATPILYEVSSPFNHLFKDIIEGFLNAGHHIIRIVACEDEHDEGYKLGIEHENINYIPVIRKKVNHGNIIKRYIFDLHTAIKITNIIKSIKADVLFEDVGYSSYWVVKSAKKRNMKVISMLQDIWPDNAVQSGLIKKKSLLYNYFEMWQKLVYRKSDKLICISDDMKKFIESKGIDKNKISVIYNWGYSDETVDISWNDNLFVKKYNLNQEKFYVVYAGNIGRMQNVEIIIKAAEKLSSNKHIQFLIIGDGANKKVLEQSIHEKKINNVIMLPFQDSTLAPSIYSVAGVNIIPLVKGGIQTALPSKTGVILSCGKPVVFCFDRTSSFTSMCNQYDLCYCVSSTDEDELVDVINELSTRRDDLINIGARDIYKSLFVRTENIKKYVELLNDFNGS